MTTTTAWPFLDPRMDRERVVRICYMVGRLGYFWCDDCGFIFWKQRNTARQYPAQLVKRGLLETFPRQSPADPHVYRISQRTLEWLVNEVGCAPSELWRPASMKHLNVPAARGMCRFWCSLVAACKGSGIRLHRFLPERQLRRMKSPTCPIVPDALFVLEADAPDGKQQKSASQIAWFVEQDNGTERLKVWADKIRGYRSSLRSGRLYGIRDGLLLVLAPSRKRAANISRTVVAAGGGQFTFAAVASTLEGGCALASVLWRAPTLAADEGTDPSNSLLSARENPARSLSATPVRPDRGSKHVSGGIS